MEFVSITIYNIKVYFESCPTWNRVYIRACTENRVNTDIKIFFFKK